MKRSSLKVTLINRIFSLSFLFIASLMSCSYAQVEQTEALCPPGIPETANDADFLLIPNGEIMHIASNLVFMRCSIGQVFDGATCLGEPTAHTWQDALQISQTNTFNNLSSWRLPNVKELSVIIERACVRPSVNDAMFPNTSPDDYWTSTPSLFDEGGAWAVAFTNGSNSVKLKNRSLFVRLVRTRLPEEN